MKNLILILFLLCGCGNKIDVTLEKQSKKILTKGRFFITTNESSISSYNIVKRFNLYTLIPNLDELDISENSYEIISEALEHASRYEPYNVAVLVKDDNCLVEVGYCRAVLIKKNL